MEIFSRLQKEQKAQQVSCFVSECHKKKKHRDNNVVVFVIKFVQK